MPGNYTITNRSDRELITQPKYLADHQQHVDNLEPPKVDDYSGSLAQMQTVTDPGEVGSENQPTSLAGELERIRFAIREIKGTAQWYESAPTGLATMYEPGDIKPTFRHVAAAGWLICNGQVVSRTTYAALFAVIGTTHGAGDGVSTFSVPNMIGRVPVGVWPGGPYGQAMGQLFGEISHVLTVSEMPFHDHTWSDPGHAHNSGKNVGVSTPGAGADLLAASGPVAAYNTSVNGSGITFTGQGGGGAHNNVQPGIACNWMIKT